ncbi:MAG: tetratricopeptide repeat protein [Sphingomonadales bacterium]|jgi:tol-pal system protein YbgF
MSMMLRSCGQPWLVAALLLLAPLPAAAQVIDIGKIDKRVTALEGQVRAVQRKVFPGGDPKFFEPEIAAPTPAAPAPDAAPASQPIDDLTQRVDAMETQLRTLTGQMEALQFRQQQQEASNAKLRGDLEFRLAALEKAMAPPAPEPAADAAPPAAPPAATPAAPLPGKPAPAGVKPAAPPAKPATAPLTTPAAAAPLTAEAAYAAALTPVKAKNWPAAETAMRQFATDWPKSPRLPMAQYWEGRSHAEQGEHAEAARLFLKVYQSAPRSEKAPDALLGLAGALTGLNKPQDACRVLDELASVYAEKLTPPLLAGAKAQRAKAKCPA